MNLLEFSTQIDEVFESDLAVDPKTAALELIASTIRRCAWHPWAKSEAKALAAKAESLAESLGGSALDGMDFLAKHGMLK